LKSKVSITNPSAVVKNMRSGIYKVKTAFPRQVIQQDP